MEERPDKKFKKLFDEYNELSRQIQRDYKAKKITAIEAWNMLPAPEPIPNIIPTCTTQMISNGYRHGYDYDGEGGQFLGNLMSDIVFQAWGGFYPFPMEFNITHQKAEWFDKHLREGRDRRANDIYHQLKQASDDYQRKIKEQDDLENAIADKREADRRRKVRMAAYRHYYETNPDAWKEKPF
jgi:uncharacterized protein YdcH (DUF465 family)